MTTVVIRCVALIIVLSVFIVVTATWDIMEKGRTKDGEKGIRNPRKRKETKGNERKRK